MLTLQTLQTRARAPTAQPLTRARTAFIAPAFIAPVLWLALTLAPPAAPAADFVRGDTNGDGAVTISDARFLQAFLFLGGEPFECMDTADADDDGSINIADTVRILTSRFLPDGESIPAPGPSAGSDPTEDSLSCDDYGNGTPVVDPEAVLEIVSSSAPGGTEGTATIVVAIGSSRDLSGYELHIDLPPGLATGVVTGEPVDHTPGEWTGFSGGKVEEDTLSYGFLKTLADSVVIPAGETRVVGEFSVCLAEGASGTHPLTLTSAELIDNESGQAIYPTLIDGTLTVESEVTEPADCTIADDPPPPPPINVTFRLPDAAGAPESAVTVPLLIQADGGLVQGYTASIDFDEEVLQVQEFGDTLDLPEDVLGFKLFEYSNANESPGNGGVDEGFVIAAHVFSFLGEFDLSAVEEVEVARIDFMVRPDAPEETTAVTFLAGAQASGQPVENIVTIGGASYTPDVLSSFVLVDCNFQVLPDITPFIRGDANNDLRVDISDPIHTLGFLFGGGPAPSCMDAADGNDDGIVNVADPTYVLNYLFDGGPDIPAPYPEQGFDATIDELFCDTEES